MTAGRQKKAVANVKGHISREEIEERQKQEALLKTLPKDRIKPPVWLSKRGKSIFKDVAENLDSVDILANVDNYNLAILADGIDKYIEATNKLDALGSFTTYHTNKSGATNEVEHPMVNIQLKYAELVKKYSAVIGLNPASRLKIIQVNGGGDSDGFDDDFE